MLLRIGTFLADLGYWTRTHRLLSVLLATTLAVSLTVYLVLGRDSASAPGQTFEVEAFRALEVGGSARSLKQDLGEPDHIDRGESAVTKAWVEGQVEYYVITTRNEIVSLGRLACDDKDASAC